MSGQDAACFAAVLGAAISLLVARAAGGPKRALWGFLGPIGWVIAAIHRAAEDVTRAVAPRPDGSTQAPGSAVPPASGGPQEPTDPT